MCSGRNLILTRKKYLKISLSPSQFPNLLSSFVSISYLHFTWRFECSNGWQKGASGDFTIFISFCSHSIDVMVKHTITLPRHIKHSTQCTLTVQTNIYSHLPTNTIYGWNCKETDINHHKCIRCLLASAMPHIKMSIQLFRFFTYVFIAFNIFRIGIVCVRQNEWNVPSCTPFKCSKWFWANESHLSHRSIVCFFSFLLATFVSPTIIARSHSHTQIY